MLKSIEERNRYEYHACMTKIFLNNPRGLFYQTEPPGAGELRIRKLRMPAGGRGA
jgi:hypothetical protein